MSNEENAAADPEIAMLEPIKETKLSTAMGISAVAMTMALRYHDINTVQDGALYQQYKLEGKNMHGLHLDMVFETAQRIELHLLSGEKRIANLIASALEGAFSEDALSEDEPEAEKGADETAADLSSPPA